MNQRIHRGLYGSTFQLDNFTEGYVDVVDAVMDNGADVAPRGSMTREILAATIIVPAAAAMLPVGTGRGVNTKLAAVEALQVVGGYSDPAAFAEWPHMSMFMDQGTFHGAYGPRLRPQMDMIVRRLQEDSRTRRAVVTLWDPLRDGIEGVQNYPCTTELQFLVRDERVDLHVTMRANDAWHGLAYDAFVFSQLQHTVANILGRQAGMYVHHANSLHVYEEHWPLTERLEYPTREPGFMPYGFRSFERARLIGTRDVLYSADLSETWYLAKSDAPTAVAR